MTLANRCKILSGLAFGLGAPGIALAQNSSGAIEYGYGPRMMWWEGGWDTMFLGPFFMILVFAALVVVAALALRAFGTALHGPVHSAHPPQRTALDILKERFARGEIDRAEFEERRKLLNE